MNRALPYVLFVALSLGGGLLIGLSNLPDAWYQSLEKPWFTPPNWVFGPAWSVLYVLVGVAGARAWLRAMPDMLTVWFLQMVLNFLWSPTFFRLKSPELALAIIMPLLVVIVGFVVMGWRRDRISSTLFIPYASWVAYASALNASIAFMN